MTTGITTNYFADQNTLYLDKIVTVNRSKREYMCQHNSTYQQFSFTIIAVCQAQKKLNVVMSKLSTKMSENSSQKMCNIHTAIRKD